MIAPDGCQTGDQGTTVRRERVLASAGLSSRLTQLAPGTVVFAQGAAANAVFYLLHGSIKLSVLSARGKKAVVGRARSR